MRNIVGVTTRIWPNPIEIIKGWVFLFLLLAFVVFTGNTIACAGTYWVSPTGTATWATCSGSTPLNGALACSLATANANANAGDIVNLRAGTYNAQLIRTAHSGTANNPITFTAYRSGSVSKTTFENAFPNPPNGQTENSYGDAIYNWLIAQQYVDPFNGAVKVKLTSSTILNALQATFTDPAEVVDGPSEYQTILGLLQSAQYEDVEMTSEFIPNRSMQTGAWIPCTTTANPNSVCVNGAISTQSSNEAWDWIYPTNYSTKFMTTAAGQGIQSGAFSLYSNYGAGFDLEACAYSNQNLIHLEIIGSNGSTVMYNKDVSLYPNQWTCFSTGYMATGASGSGAYVLFTAPASIPAGQWYVGDVRMHTYESIIGLNGNSYIRLLGLNLSDADSAFSMQSGSNDNEIADSTFTNMDIYSIGTITGPNGDTPAPGSQYNWIHDNVFHDNGWVQASTGDTCFENGDQMRIGESNIDDASIGNLIENNTFYHTGHDQALIATQHNTIRNNIMHNENWSLNHYAVVTKYTFEDAFPTEPASYGDNIFSWLTSNNFLDAVGHPINSYGVTIANGGTNYVQGDVLTMYQSGAYGGQVTVQSVTAGGVITALVPTPTNHGTNYTYGTATTAGGHGSGATVNIIDAIANEFTDNGEAVTIHSVMNGYNACGLTELAPTLANFQSIFGNTEGSTIFNWLTTKQSGQSSAFVDPSSYQVQVNLQSQPVLAALQSAFTPNEYQTIISILANPYLGARDLLIQQPSLSYDNDSGYNLVEGNRLGNAGTPYTEGSNGIENATNGNIIRFNYLWNADASGIEWKGSSTEGGVPYPSSNMVYNNTFYNNGGGVSILTGKQGALQFNDTTTSGLNATGNVIINNILNDSQPSAFGGTSVTQFESQNTLENNDSTSTPLFSNTDLSYLNSTTLPNLVLQKTSPDLGQGMALTTVASVDAGTGTVLSVNNASFFQDSSWGTPGHLQPDVIAVGTTSNTVAIATPGTGATVNIVAATSGNDGIISATVANPGSGYHVGDVLTVFQTGTVVVGSTTEAANGGTLTVTSLSGSGIATLNVNTPGFYYTTANGLSTADSTINYESGTINLANSIIRSPGNNVWLYKNSNGQQVLVAGSGPNIGADVAQPYLLTASATGAGFGVVNASAAGNADLISCGLDNATPCSAIVNGGTVVTVTAVPSSDTNSVFSGWTVTGAPSDNTCIGTVSPCSFTVTAPTTLTAAFSAFSVNGSCGPADQTYLYNQTSFGNNALCKSGTPNPSTVSFPEPGDKVRWTCVGSNGGFNSTCKAKRNPRAIIKLL